MTTIAKRASLIAGGADAIGAGLFAFGLARAIGAIAAPGASARLPLTAIAALIAGVGVRALVGFWQAAIGGDIGRDLAAGWRARVMPALLGGRLGKPLAPGTIATLGTDHLAAIRDYGESFVPARLGASIGPLIVLALVACASWVAALILAMTLVVFIAGMILAGSAARHAADRQLAALASLSASFVDRVMHLALIRHFGAEDRLARQLGAATSLVATRTLAVLRIAFVSSAVLEFVAALAVAMVAVYCGFALLGLLPFDAPEHLTLTAGFFVLVLAPEFYLPMRRLAAAYHEKQLGEAAMQALDDAILATMPTAAPGEDAPAANTPAAPATPAAWCGIVVRDLVITWPEMSTGSTPSTIGPVSLALGDHGLIVLAGPTGSGKTTLLAAIAGLIAPSAGSVLGGDGQPIAPSLIATAAQQPLLLPGTLASNIALARPEASLTMTLAVAEQVGLSPMLRARPQGLATPIDHRGAGLSGGERRRVGLARALLSGRPLLLLDEPTADLDAGSAGAITALIVSLARRQPVIVASHDPALVALADHTVTL